MKISAKDWNGYNPECPTVQKAVKFLKENGEIAVEDLFNFLNYKYDSVILIKNYLNPDRVTEYQRWAFDYFSFEFAYKEHEAKLDRLKSKIWDVENDLKHKERLATYMTPARVYEYFRFQHKFTSDRIYSKSMYDILESILATRKFEENDYVELRKSLRGISIPHHDAEEHYATAVRSNNSSLWKQIESYLERKPFIIDKKRCYQGFSFQLSEKENYRCTGWNEMGRIKFIQSSDRRGEVDRKLLNFNREEFMVHFKDKKIIWVW
jgi:hypothetical protein